MNKSILVISNTYFQLIVAIQLRETFGLTTRLI